jgi:hypothetical protein
MGAASSCFPCKRKQPNRSVKEVTEKLPIPILTDCGCKTECCLHADFQEQRILNEILDHENRIKKDVEGEIGVKFLLY